MPSGESGVSQFNVYDVDILHDCYPFQPALYTGSSRDITGIRHLGEPTHTPIVSRREPGARRLSPKVMSCLLLPGICVRLLCPVRRLGRCFVLFCLVCQPVEACHKVP